MDHESQQIVNRLEKLLFHRSEVTSELANVDTQIATVVSKRKQKQKELNAKKKKEKKESLVEDSRGDCLSVGYIVDTSTQGKYFERRANITAVHHES